MNESDSSCPSISLLLDESAFKILEGSNLRAGINPDAFVLEDNASTEEEPGDKTENEQDPVVIPKTPKGRVHGMSGSDYFDKWRLTTVRYGADYVVDTQRTRNVNEAVDELRQTCTELNDTFNMDPDNFLATFPIYTSLYLVANCVLHLKDKNTPKQAELERVSAILDQVFNDPVLCQTREYEEFLNQVDIMLSFVWKCPLLFALPSQRQTVMNLARWRPQLFLDHAVGYLSEMLDNRKRLFEPVELEALATVMEILRRMRLTHENLVFLRGALEPKLLDIDIRVSLPAAVASIEQLLDDPVQHNEH